MSVLLTNAKYRALMSAMTRIARAYQRTEAGKSRLSKEKVETIARDTCDLMGWPYHGAELAELPIPRRPPPRPENRHARSQFSELLRQRAIR